MNSRYIGHSYDTSPLTLDIITIMQLFYHLRKGIYFSHFSLACPCSVRRHVDVAVIERLVYACSRLYADLSMRRQQILLRQYSQQMGMYYGFENGRIFCPERRTHVGIPSPPAIESPRQCRGKGIEYQFFFI